MTPNAAELALGRPALRGLNEAHQFALISADEVFFLEAAAAPPIGKLFILVDPLGYYGCGLRLGYTNLNGEITPGLNRMRMPTR